MPAIDSTSGRLHSEFVRLLFLQTQRETDLFFATSGVQFTDPNSGLFHYLRVVFSSQLKSKIDNILPKSVTLWIILNIDGVPVGSRSHTHPSHSQTSRLLTSSLSLGVSVPHNNYTDTPLTIFSPNLTLSTIINQHQKKLLLSWLKYLGFDRTLWSSL